MMIQGGGVPNAAGPERLADLVSASGGPTGASSEYRRDEAGGREARPRLLSRLAEVNKELWLVLSMLLIAVAMNYLVTGQRVILGVYGLPTLFSAYFYGRRHAVLTAIASVVLVGFLTYTKPAVLAAGSAGHATHSPWFDVAAWGGILIVTAIAMGSLHERHRIRLAELRQTYHGLLLLLRQFVSKDQQTENHCYRVSIYAAKIAAHMGLSSERIEDVRAASLLHDIGRVGVTRQLLQQASRLSAEEHERATRQSDPSQHAPETVGGPLRRIIPIVLAHVDKLDTADARPSADVEMPLEARIIAVADVYDSLTSDHPYRKAMSPFEVKGIIVRCAGTEFDARVVEAFQKAFKSGDLEVRGLAA